MAKRIVVQFPEGSPVEKMDKDEIRRIVEEVTGRIPKEEHKRHAEEVVLQKSGALHKAGEESPEIIIWSRKCFQ